MNIYCRLYSTTARQDLVMTGCTAKVAVVDVHASVVMAQKFHNPLTTAIPATYTFSMLAGSAICGFEMVRQDGTKVEGVVKEKQEAKKEFQEAVSQGLTASLGEEQTKDVFSISVGNILPSETVTINLRFLQPLTDDEKRDQLRFTFPRAYAQRYGAAPTVNAALASAAHQPFTLEMAIQQAGPIKSVSCPSGHSISFEFGPPEGVTTNDFASFARVTLNEPSGHLTQDVILVISAANLDGPRCFVEPHPSPNQLTTAVGLTFVPRFKLPDVEGGMEYIFLIDRSGSMQGDRIRLVREALVVLLRGLPTKDTSFNLVSFGSSSSKLWETSKRYTQDSLDEATRHVDSMQANYGGTEIAGALQTVFDSLQKPLQKPVSLLLLTDGGAWDIDNCVRRTETAIKDLPGTGTFLRVFTVGIGDGVSTNTCDSIARVGNGISVYVSQGEAMTGKCSRLIRAARTPPVVDLKVSWPGTNPSLEDDDEFELIETDHPKLTPQKPKAVNLFSGDDDDDSSMDVDEVGPPKKPVITLPPTAAIQQAPIIIPSLVPGTRTQIYAIISNDRLPKGAPIPSSIRVSGKVLTTGGDVELDVPLARLLITSSSTEKGERPKPILHTLAAKALITDREDGKHSFTSTLGTKLDKDPELKAAYLEQDIIRLGTTYNLTSKHTSFVAVDRKNTDQTLGTQTTVVITTTTVHHNVARPMYFSSAAPAPTMFGATGSVKAQHFAKPASSGLFGRARPSVPLTPSQPPAFGATFPAGAVPPTQAVSPIPNAFLPPSPPQQQLQSAPAGFSNLFGTSQPYSGASFGAAQPAQSVFGAPSAAGATSLFGSAAAPASSDDLLGVFQPQLQSAASFGTAQPAQSAIQSFGAPNATGVTSLFGSTAAPASSSNLFGASQPFSADEFDAVRPAQSAFGAPSATSLFGSMVAPTSSSNLFGAPQTTGGLGVGFGSAAGFSQNPFQTPSPSQSLAPGERLASIARLQSFDGGFKLTESLLQLLKTSVTDVDTAKTKLAQVRLDADVGATLLAWKWLSTNANEEAIDMIEKAEEHLKDVLGNGVSLDDLVSKIVSLIAFL